MRKIALWLRSRVCFLIGHNWDSLVNPRCLRCPYEIEANGYAGEVYIGWGKFGLLTSPPERN
jgi:hypothetical protein